MHYISIINELKKQTNKVMLFHSGTGKDSIMLCDLLSKNFDNIQCIFMYIVKGLEYENKYLDYAKKKYSNIEIHQTPHYCLPSFIKNGYLGIKQNKEISNTTISKIDAKYRNILGIDYSVYGFKKIDGITRRVMLNTYKNGISNTNKAYPLMDLKNIDVLNYINDNRLITPFNYGTTKPSSGCDISTPQFLQHIKKNYPKDLIKIYEQFPYCENILYKYENL
jgi:3'-phosphoadenosine 5'-phosphosulfate sulfotransferase (PAPS reductase)/FAD synthetase